MTDINDTSMKLKFSCYPMDNIHQSNVAPVPTSLKMHDKYSRYGTYPRSKHTVPVNDEKIEPGKCWSKDVSLSPVTVFDGTVRYGRCLRTESTACLLT
jgi:hypothetical protein